MAENLDDKVLGFEGRDVAFAASGAAIGIGLDYFGISDKFMAGIYRYLSLDVGGYSSWLPSIDPLVNTPLLNIAGVGSFISAAAGSPRGIFLSWAAPIVYSFAKAAFDYGGGLYVGSLGSVAASTFFPITAFVGIGLAAGYLFRAIYKLFKKE